MSSVGRKIKIVLIGDSSVGKTSLRKRYMGEGFRGTYTATLGSEFSVKKIKNDTITLFDLAGDPGSKFLRHGYYNGTDGFIMVFDVVNRTTFENLDDWFKEITSSLHRRLKIFILGNKDDLRDVNLDSVEHDEVYEYARDKAEKLGASVSYLPTSALTGYNVDVAFSKLIAEIAFEGEM